MLQNRPILLTVMLTLLAACAPGPVAEASASEAPAPSETAAPTATATPFPRDAAGHFTGAPADFVLPLELLGSDYTAGQGEARPNSFVLENRADGDAYLAATGRLDGWRQQYDRVTGAGPLYVLQVVNVYEMAAGAELAISRDWHSAVWDAIDSGDLELLPGISGLGVQHIVWRTADGTVAVEMIYRNLYLYLSGPAEGVDYYDFLADLARAQVDWLRENEKNKW